MNKVTCRTLSVILSNDSLSANFRTFATKLMEVGRLVAPKTTETYKIGQLFLHRLFGYRGVILLPWPARVFDRDKLMNVKADGVNNTDTNELYEEDKRSNTNSAFYNVLIDTRDHPFVRAHTSAVTVLRNSDDSNKRDLYSIPGLDYTSHEDVMPYTPSVGEKQPLQHQLAGQFLSARPGEDPPLVPREILSYWQRENRHWLEVREVHRQTTEKIRVTVVPFFIGRRESLTHEEFWWRYWICLENTGELAVRLRERHWRIFSETGALETVRGRGVLGQEPILSPGLPAFQYSSHVSLKAPFGHMWGTLRMENEDGHVFDCKIPRFSLKSSELED